MSTLPKKTLTCAEFQEQLPELFAQGGKISENPEYAEHLRTCDNCSALVRDLEYIAETARQLLDPGHEVEPSDDVWNRLQHRLEEDPETPKPKPNGHSV